MSSKFRLSVMMFLQYAIWGAWLPILWPFLAGYRGFSPSEITNMFAVGALGALLAPFIAGQIADRYFATEKFLAISHLLGAVLMWQLASIESYGGFLVFSLLYSLIYAPTLSLTNSICFHHLTDRDKEFGKVRVWGTVGWIVVGIMVGQWLKYEYTPTPQETARWVVDEKFVDAVQRQHTLTLSQIELRDKSVVTGKILRNDASGLELETGTDGTKLEFAAEEVITITPLLETIAAAGQVDAVRAAIGRLATDSTQASAVAEELLQNNGLTSAALKEPVQRAHDQGRADGFRLSAILGALLGLFCFLLPRTPPQKSSGQSATLAAWARIRTMPLLALFLLAVPVSCIHQFFFVHTAEFLSQFSFDTQWIDRIFGVGGGGLMTLGQVSELVVLGCIPLFAKRFSRKLFLAIGLLAYALRMALFAYVGEIENLGIAPEVTLMIGISLHGFCFGCFIFVSFMIVDEQTSGDVRASAQSLYNFVIIGIGIIVGSKIAGWVAEWATLDEVTNYTKLFSVPMWAALACLVTLVVIYPRRSATYVEQSSNADGTR